MAAHCMHDSLLAAVPQALAGGDTPDALIEVIDCNPVSPSRLNVPLNAFTQSTIEVRCCLRQTWVV